MQLEVVVHHLAQAQAVLRAAAAMHIDIQLRSAPGAAAAAGVGYLQALGEAVDHELLVDCDEDAGLMMAGLRAGCRQLAFAGDDVERQRLQQIAERYGATIRGAGPDLAGQAPLCLVLSPDEEDVVIRTWLAAQPKV